MKKEEKQSEHASFLTPMVTYAQNFEDVLLRRALQDIEAGFYIDLGAFDPIEDSVTAWFYSEGWRGINVEPNPDFHARLMEQRPEDLNLQVAVSDGPGTLTLHLMDGLSSAADEIVELHAAQGRDVGRTVEVKTVSLDTILEEHANARTVDFLKVDIEGLEATVLNACKFEAVRPRIIVVEANLPDSTEPAWRGWQKGLLEKDYLFAWSDGLNRYYVRKEDAWRADVIASPPSVFDSFRLRAEDRRVAFLSKEGPKGLLQKFHAFMGERRAQTEHLESENTRLARENSSLLGALESANDRSAAFGAEVDDINRQLEQLRKSAAVHVVENALSSTGNPDEGAEPQVSEAQRQVAFEKLRSEKRRQLEELRPQPAYTLETLPERRSLRENAIRMRKRLGRSIRKRVKRLFGKT
ncbi:MAG: FkbM family methyltransferase [Pseudomonadota bacterium]